MRSGLRCPPFFGPAGDGRSGPTGRSIRGGGTRCGGRFAYCGIDLDHCRDFDSGVIEPWAHAMIDRLSSYTELSPSQTGVHILVKAALPPGGRHKDKIEMYDHGRYFTVTGCSVDGLPVWPI